MEVPNHRKWMDNRVGPDQRTVTDEFMAGVLKFIDFACAHCHNSTRSLRCPCKKCKCLAFHHIEDVKGHLCMRGFMRDYYYWTSHGEQRPPITPIILDDSYYGRSEGREEMNNYEQMVMDAAGPSVGNDIEQQGFRFGEQVTEDPNPIAKKFFEMLAAAQAPLYEGCEEYSELSAAIEALSIKSDFNSSQTSFNRWVDFMGKALPNGNRMPRNFYYAKKSVEQLGLGRIKIDCCPNGCMIYHYGDDKDLQNCKFCGENRYKTIIKNGKRRDIPLKKMWYFPLIPRLQRLYSSMQTATQMRWHRENQREPNNLSHPSDGLAWKHFDSTYPQFAQDPRNVRLGLCADGFSPFDQTGRIYSCWPVVITPYNLPPWMCMRREFMFLTVLIPGPSNPKIRIDVYLQPLIDDLKLLWNTGVITYDVSLKQNFMMKACLMWTINDFPAYGMLSGWMTMGKLACPICMDRSKAFTLKHSRKTSFFDCHRQFLPLDHSYRQNKTAFRKKVEERSLPPRRLTGEEVWEKVRNIPTIIESMAEKPPGYGVDHNWTKRSIFWELPYWKANLLPHNLDVMHIERNVFLNILYTVMDTKGKTKDNFNARLDLAQLCRRLDLELQDVGGGKLKKPKAKYTLSKQQRLAMCQWIRQLKLPDGYASTLGRCVDLREAKLFGMKSHDCHVFMQCLLPIAFRALPKPIWNTLTELSTFFKALTSPTLREDNLQVMEQNIPVILCKLEQIFPPSFFDSMEHLPIHLPYEARVGGPVQYRWMYPFERFDHLSLSLTSDLLYNWYCTNILTTYLIRFIRTLKDKVTNKAAIEGSICEAYLVEETSTFASYYYPPDVPCRRTRVPRNDDGGEGSSTNPSFSIFNYPGRSSGKCNSCFLEEREIKAAHLYILLNCPEVEPFLVIYENNLRDLGLNDSEVENETSTNFPSWFREHVSANNIEDILLKSLAWGPLNQVNKWHTYFLNGYKFNTKDYGQGMSTTNCGVCVRCGDNDGIENDWHGVLTDIVEVQYVGWPIKKVVLFKCDWFDPTVDRGTRIDNYGIVEVKASRRYKKYEPFILAQQAEQVYYSHYPEGQDGWLVVIKTKARNTIQISEAKIPEMDDPYQDESIPQVPMLIANDNIEQLFVDLTGPMEEVADHSLNAYDFDLDGDFEIEEEEEDIEVEQEEEEDIEVEEEEEEQSGESAM